MAKTPTLSEVINLAIENNSYNLHTSIPAIVESFDYTKKTISAKIALKRKYKSENQSKELPILTDIPILYPQTNKSIISFPLEKKDPVLLIFSERSIDAWKTTGGITDPQDTRKHNISDAIAIPGVFPISGGIQIEEKNFLLKFNNALIKLTDNDKISIGNNTVELLQIISDLLQGLVDAKVNTQLGPQPLINAATFANLKSLLGNLKV